MRLSDNISAMDPYSRTVAFVPARSGSKGIPNKNLARLAGRSLIEWAVSSAMAVSRLRECVVSTDGDEIAREAKRLGAHIHFRPPELAQDDSLLMDSIRHFIQQRTDAEQAVDTIVVLEPTSPFRTTEDIARCLDALEQGADSAATFSVSEVHPERLWRQEGGRPTPFIEGANPWKPRQALQPEAYRLTGGVYAFRVGSLPIGQSAFLFGEARLIQVPQSRCVDIDSELDLEVANARLKFGAVPGLESPPSTGR